MPNRTVSGPITFRRPFTLPGIDGPQSAGTYIVENDEELIEGLSFEAYRRVATMIHLPAGSGRLSFSQTVLIDPRDLDAARALDALPEGAS